MKTISALCLFAGTALIAIGYNPHLSSPVVLVNPGQRANPCPTSTACSNNSGGKILYDWYTSSNSPACDEIWSMNLDGTGKTDLSASAPSAVYGPGSNQALGSYRPPNGDYILFSAEHSPRSQNNCNARSEDAGSGPNSEIWACSNMFGTNCAKLNGLVIPNTGNGWLWPTWSPNGTLIGAAYVYTNLTSPIGCQGTLHYMTFVPGTPPSITGDTSLDPAGGGGTGNYCYEMASWGSDNCTMYFLESLITGTLDNVQMASYNTCAGSGSANGSYRVLAVAPTINTFNEWWAMNPVNGATLSTSTAFNNSQTGSDLISISQTGSGPFLLTSYNFPGAPEYSYPTLVKNPKWFSDGSAITITVVPGALQPGEAGYTAYVASYKWNFVPSVVSGTSYWTGKNKIQ